MSQGSNRGWLVALSGTGINLALGVLYSWSVISKEIPADWGWSETYKAWPYTIACLVFAFMMVPAGKMYDLYQSFEIALYLAGAFLLVTLVLSFILSKPEMAGATAPSKANA